MSGEQDVAYFRGSNGIIHEFALPLPEEIQLQVDKHWLVQCNEDGSSIGESSEPKRPKDYDTKAKWEGYAISLGLDPEDAAEMTKKDLIEVYGQE
jgi:hypothetical protein